VLVVQLRSPRGAGPAGDEVTLEVTRRSVAQGDQRSVRKTRTGQGGEARFEGLQAGSSWVYRALARHDGVEYASPELGLSATWGKRVGVRVFEATTDIDAALVGVQAFLILEPRDDVLQIEQLLRYTNLGERTWVARGLGLALPAGHRALQASEEHSDLRVELVQGQGVLLSGSVPPGAREVSFRYQIPYGGEPSLRFVVPMPARVAQVRVIAMASGSSKLQVERLPEPVITEGKNGQKLLVTEQLVAPGGDQIDDVRVALHGILVPGPGRWYASLLALGAACVGLAAAFAARLRRPGTTARGEIDLERAKVAVLQEIEQVEIARRDGVIGPKTYEHSKRRLVDALARLVHVSRVGSSRG
jgi:hypothetical protein